MAIRKSFSLTRACALVLVFAFPFAALAQDWVARFNGSASDWEEAHDLAVTKHGIHVVGFSYQTYGAPSFATVKYDHAGNQKWVRTYGFAGPNNGASAEAVAVDGDGNVVVTGRSAQYVAEVPERIYVDAATVKYDAFGNVLWERRLRMPGGNTQPQDIVIDGASNIYIAGADWDGQGFNLMLVKYSPSGTLLWSRTIGDPGQVWDAGYALAIDPSGNPVVAGYSHTGNISYGYLVKYNPAGQLQWERRRESYSNSSAWWKVAVNAQGRIYVMGEIAPPGDLHHIWTAQYDSNGTLVWERDYDGTSSGGNYRGGLALTPTGGVIVNGISDDFVGFGQTNIVTIKYEPDGSEAWRRLERGGYDQAGGRDVAVDAFGHAYVLGWGFNQNENMDFVTLKYRPNGELVWTKIYEGPAGLTDFPSKIALDPALNVFVTGYSHGGLSTYFDFATIRYMQFSRG